MSSSEANGRDTRKIATQNSVKLLQIYFQITQWPNLRWNENESIGRVMQKDRPA